MVALVRDGGCAGALHEKKTRSFDSCRHGGGLERVRRLKGRGAQRMPTERPMSLGLSLQFNWNLHRSNTVRRRPRLLSGSTVFQRLVPTDPRVR